MDQFSAHVDRAWDLIARGEMRGASSSAEQAKALEPKSAEVWNLLGYISAAEGDAEEALEHYRHAITLDEGYLEPILNAAELLIYPLAEYEEAIALCDEALDLAETPEEVADAMLLKIDASLARGDVQRAGVLLDEMPEGPFETPHYDMLIGRALYDVGRFDAARVHLEAALQKDDRLADAHYYLGAVADDAGRPADAVRHFLAARTLDLAQPRAVWSLPAIEFERVLRQSMDQVLAERDLGAVLEGVEVHPADYPGLEVVVDGVDPRCPLLFDGPPSAPGAPAARLFVYQRNVERLCHSVVSLRDELPALIIREIDANRREPAPQPKPKARPKPKASA